MTEVGAVQDRGGQPGLFPEPARLFTCTPSKLVSYEECPRRYRFTYLDRPTPPKGPPLRNRAATVVGRGSRESSAAAAL